MAGHWIRGAAGAVLAAALTATAAGCSDGSTPSDAASSVASRASDAVESGSAEAKKRIDEIKGGVDARDDVELGDVASGDGGRVTVPVRAENGADATKSFGVQVNFTDKDGNLLDSVFVTVSDVAAGKSGEATARSTRKLSGDGVQAKVGAALRY